MNSNILSANEKDTQVQERIAELERANQELRSEIFERDRAEKELREEKFRLLQAQEFMEATTKGTDIIIATIDTNLCYTYFNKAYQKEVQRLSGKEIHVGESMIETFANLPEQQKIVIEEWSDALEGNSTEKMLAFGDPGLYRKIYDVHRTPIRDAEGKIVGAGEVAHDITEKIHTEEALRESESSLKLAQISAGAGVWDWDMSTDKLEWSEELFRLFGLDFMKANASFDIWRSVIHPNDRLIAEKRIETAVNNHIPLENEYRIVLPSGEIRWIKALGNTLYDIKGKPQRMSGICIDITESKKIQEALRLSSLYNRSLIEASLDPLVTIGSEGKITDVNDATQKVTGYSRNDLIGTDFSDYFTEPEKAKKGYQHVFTEGEIRDYPLEIQHKDGHITPVLYNASVYRDENGKVIGVFAAARDIAALKKAEDALKNAYDCLEEKVKERTAELEKAYNLLKESERSLADAQKIAHIGNWDWDLITNEVYWSYELYRIFGRDPQKPGASYEELLNYIHPSDRDHVEKSIQNGLKEEPKSGINYRIILVNGEERTVHSLVEVILDKQNIPIRVKGIVQDITESKKNEEKLQLLADIVKSSNDAIGTISLDCIITGWNEGAEHVYGYSAEEVIGKHISILAPPHLDKESEKLSELIKQGKKIQNYETPRLRKDGKIIYVSVTLSPVFDGYGKLTAISFISRDITERKRIDEKLRDSEEKYRNIVETANEGIGIIDNEFKLTFVNKKLEDMIGYRAEEIMGNTMWFFLSEESKRNVNLILERGLQEFENPELKFIQKDGSPLWAQVNAKPIFDGDGKLISIITMLSDINKRKEAEESLAKIEIARKKEIHHRIKNNLQVISSLLDLQAEQFRNRKNIPDIEVLEAFRESQNRVISMALIHEELYKGEEFETLNFSLYIKELAENLFNTYKLENIDLILSMNLEENLFFDMDTAVPLGIVVNELVTNSLKHAFPDREKGEIRIKLSREGNKERIKSINEACKSTHFTLTVSDNGIGIPENLDIENLDSLGFQLVTSLVHQLDGEFELKRKNGTEFTMRFTVTENNNQALELQQLTDL